MVKDTKLKGRIKQGLIGMIRKWEPTLESQGIKLVPVSELLKEYNL